MVDKKYFFALACVFILFGALVVASDSVSAAKYKKIDNGENKLIYKNSWKSYYNGKTVVTAYKMYVKYPNKLKYEIYVNNNIYLTKVSKNKLKVTVVNHRTKNNPYGKYTDYVKTVLSAKSYYNKFYKKSFRNPGA
jgi:hypothetical protein